ncbi:class I SAM-dependent methyltransferase [Bacillus cereus group sp. BfR-BA-01380]|uniref:class I SAM-dependent methyltransferase n=1 Tax=Bacillus cereus group sp. BfR-BA-01380 TaxID=2920324 RepID=UPI001F58068E|nr:rRNA adenine N-6-methyltransferase family protein [Bacillus cereus group sp. BfR-BA-01380]
MHVLHFLREYIKHPRTVGAILSSSKRLANQMISPINFEQAKCIIEYGPGTGVFTEQLIQHKQNETVLLIIENNKQFHQILRDKYAAMKNVYIIHDSAEYTEKYIQQYKIPKVDYIISGLPFTSLPLDTSKKILQVTKEVLGQDGKFITFQYTRLKQQFFRSFFTNIEMKKTNWNLPPAFVFTCFM